MAYKINTKKCLKCGLCVTQCRKAPSSLIIKLKRAALYHENRPQELHGLRHLYFLRMVVPGQSHQQSIIYKYVLRKYYRRQR